MDKVSARDILNTEIPTTYKLVYSAEEISKRVRELGEEVSFWAKDVISQSGQDVVAIPVLRGGIFFFSDIVRSISTSVEIFPVRSVGYEVDQINSPLEQVSISDDLSALRGRSVLLVDEICESGRTFEKLHLLLRDVGAAEVRSAVLIKRELDRQTFDPTWVGFVLKSSAWCVGYGMDDRERWRNLSDIYAIGNS